MPWRVPIFEISMEVKRVGEIEREQVIRRTQQQARFDDRDEARRASAAFFVMLLPVAIAIAFIAGACRDPGSTTVEDALEGGAVISTGASEPASTDSDGGGEATGAAGTGAPTGLPCDVQGVIENRCIACHSGTAPPPLLKFEHLVAKSTRDPAKTLAEVSVQLMKTKEMPPAPAVPAEDDEIAAFENWVKDGSKQNPKACTDMPPPRGDGGVLADGGGASGGPLVNDAGLPLGDGGCTSGKQWTQGNQGSPLMHPGAACNACHQQAGGPNLRIAGTVFPTLREPIDCLGSAPPPQITVTITDSRPGQPRVINLNVNASGNFSTEQRLTLPIKAVVREGNKTRAMQGTVNSGDCNSCHTQAGLNGAPGRILAPTN
jgi:hypothetical protein